MSAENSIIERISKKLDISIPQELLRDAITKEYDKGLESIGIRVNFNPLRDNRRISFLETFLFENIRGMTQSLQERMRKELSIAVLNNESVTQLKQRVKDIMDAGEVRAEMIARTELARAFNVGTLDAAKQSGVRTRKWLLITHDSRTTDVSKAMGRKYGSPDKAIPMDETFSVTVNGKTYEGLAPPFMPNDRDRLMITFD